MVIDGLSFCTHANYCDWRLVCRSGFLRIIGGYEYSLPPLVALSGLVERNMHCDKVHLGSFSPDVVL